jgi:calpain-15
VEHSPTEDISSLKKLIKTCKSRNFTVIASTYGHDEVQYANGILQGHAYALLSYHEVSDNGRQVSLIKLRNPWGKCDWRGDWCDTSPKWTPELRQDLQPYVDHDGTFFIDLNDYKKVIARTSICMTNDAGQYHHASVNKSLRSKQTAYFSMKINETIDCVKKCFAITVA